MENELNLPEFWFVFHGYDALFFLSVDTMNFTNWGTLFDA